MVDNGYVGNHGSLNCTKYPQYCNNGKKKSDQELQAMRPKRNNQQQDNDSLTYKFENNILLGSWDFDQDIPPDEFEDLLLAIVDDVHNKTPRELVLSAAGYDTPFYNHSTYFGIGRLSGTGCIYGKCYDRSELNYIGEGALWAAAGASKAEGHQIVTTWKLLIWINHGPQLTTPGTLEMFDLGYNTYYQVYPYPPARSSIPNGDVPEPAWP